MERFVQLVVAGGVVLVASLWGAELATPASPVWLAAVALAAVGGGVVLAGIWTELDLES